MTERHAPDSSGGGDRRARLAASSDGCSRSPRGGSAIASTRTRRRATRPPATSPMSRSSATTTTSMRCGGSPTASTSSPSSSRTCPRPAWRRSPSGRWSARPARCCTPPSTAAARRAFLSRAGLPGRALRAGRQPRRSQRGARPGSVSPPSSRPRASATTARARRASIGAEDALAAWDRIGRQPAVLEAFVDFERELSVVAARGVDGRIAHYGVIENAHARHILDVSVAPARVPPQVERDALAIARATLEALDVVGVLCVELFLTRDGRVLVNELAPRTHNSGHLTIDACATSQFEQQLRAVCGLPLGATEPGAAGGDGQPARRPVAGRRAALGRRPGAPRHPAPPLRQARRQARAARWAISPRWRTRRTTPPRSSAKPGRRSPAAMSEPDTAAETAQPPARAERRRRA